MAWMDPTRPDGLVGSPRRSALGTRLLPAGFLLAAFVLTGRAAAQALPAEGEDERLRRAWATLSEEEQREALEWHRAEVLGLGTLQGRLIAAVRATIDSDPGLWPLEEPPPIYDPAVHAPKLRAGPRTVLAPDDPRTLEVRRTLLLEPPPGALRPQYRYDWAAGRPVRALGFDPLADGFENALAGHPPDLGLARAWVLARLDRGQQRAGLAAFGHAYADREGHVFPGLSLYDAWSSGRRIEMPDVDALGVLHDLESEWTAFVSPVPAARHEELYRRIERLYEPVRLYRSLREALAAVFATGEPVGLGIHGPNRTRFHALWETHASLPDALAGALPDAPDQAEFLAAWIRGCDRDVDLMGRARAREEALARDARAVRERLAFVLGELGAFERDGPPAPAAPSGDGTPEGG